MKTLQEINKLELIGEEIFLFGDKDESNSVSVFADGNDTKESPIRIYTIDKTNAIRVFGLKKPQSIIQVEHREEILNYVIGTPTPKDEVSLCDIFMQGEFIEEIFA